MTLANIDPWSCSSEGASLTLHELTRRLDLISARLPLMVCEYPEEQEFWKAFAEATNSVFEHAGEHYDIVRKRIDEVLANTGIAPNIGYGLSK